MVREENCGLEAQGYVCCDSGIAEGVRDNDLCTNCDILHCRICDFHTTPDIWRIQGHIAMMLLAEKLLFDSIAELERYGAMGINYGR